VRGTRRWGLIFAAVLSGVVGFGVFPASAAESASYPLRVDAVAYHLPGKTASGLPVRKGVVAVDPALIPLGTRLFVPGYGRAVAADLGTAIKGRIIDLWMPSDEQARQWGRKTVVITVYR
jgi:3D (Asp-Asp-Asp) domain-containing protein